MNEQINKPPNAPLNNDTGSNYQKLYDRANNALANYSVDSPEHQQALEIKKQIEKNHPELVDSANAMTEPSIDKTVHDNTESNKDVGSKPSTQSGDGNSSSTSPPTDTSEGNLSGNYGQKNDSYPIGDFTYFLKNPDAPRSMNAEDMVRDRYGKDQSEQGSAQSDVKETGNASDAAQPQTNQNNDETSF